MFYMLGFTDRNHAFEINYNHKANLAMLWVLNVDGLTYFIGMVNPLHPSWLWTKCLSVWDTVICIYRRISLAHTRPTFAAFAPWLTPEQDHLSSLSCNHGLPSITVAFPLYSPALLRLHFYMQYDSFLASDKQRQGPHPLVKVNEGGRGWGLWSWFIASSAMTSVPSGCRGQCQSSIKRLLVKFIFMALVRPRSGCLFQPDSVPTSCSTIWMKRVVMGESLALPKMHQGHAGPSCYRRPIPKSKQMPSLVSDGLLETEQIGHFEDLWPMKCDHVVKVVVLKRPDTIFSSLPSIKNPNLLVKSQILGSDLVNNRAINELHKSMKTEVGGGGIFFQENTPNR